MLYLVIGLVVAVAVGALLNQRQSSKKKPQPPQNADGGPAEDVSAASPGTNPPAGASAPAAEQPDSGGLATLHEEIAPLDPTLAAKPLSSPNAVASATYSSAAPAGLGDESPYSYGA